MVNNHIEETINTDNLTTQDLSKGELIICHTNKDSIMLDPARMNKAKMADEFGDKSIIIRITKGTKEKTNHVILIPE